MPAFKLYKTADSASLELSGSLNAASTNAAFVNPDGALLPTITRGSATSLGDMSTLNSTGIQAAGAAVGDYIENETDGSWAIVVSVSTNSVRTTPLRNGSDNTWQNSDAWAVNAQIAYLTSYNAAGEITQSEKVRIKVHTAAADSATIERAQDGDTAKTFAAGDFLNIFVSKLHVDELQKAVRDLYLQIVGMDKGQHGYAAASNVSNAYTVNISPKVETLSDLVGKPVIWKASAANTGAATLNLNGTGAVALKKKGGNSDVASGDIANNMMVVTVYNGTYHIVVNESANGSLTSIVTTDSLTAANGNLIVADMTYNPVTVTLPASPSADDRIGIAVKAVVTRYAISLNGTNQYLSRADNASLDLTSDFTVEYWVRHASQPSSGNYKDHVAKYATTGNQRSFLMGYMNDSGTMKLSFRISSDGVTAVEGKITQTLSNATFYHIAWVYTASSGTVQAYVNGASIGSASSLPTSIFNGSATFDIGRGGELGNYTDGLLDEVRVWKGTIRTGPQILANYLKELVGNESGLTSYWKLNNALTDSTASALTLTNNNTATFSATVPFGSDVTINGNGKNITGSATRTLSTLGYYLEMQYNSTQWDIISYVAAVP